MRVVAGSARGRPLRAPAGRGTRPTSDRVREAVFDMLTSMAPLDGAVVADVFAGSGALGIEALSRGASSATFVESAPAALAAIRANLDAVPELAAAAHVRRVDALAWAAGEGTRPAGGRWDVVVADPPYAWDRWAELLAPLAAVTDLVVAETGAAWEPPAGWEVARARRYGSTVVTIVGPQPRGGQ